MLTKLTLKLDNAAIQAAKEYARKHKASVSKLVENYFKSLQNPSKKALSPIVAELSGIISKEQLKALRNSKDEYLQHLFKKYLS